MTKPIHYSAYGKKPICRLKFNDRSLTKQANKEECDINFIISKFQKTGLLQHVRAHEGDYADFDEINYHEAMNIITSAQDMFESIPASIRADFSNDPAKFIEFATNPANNQQMADYGLAPLIQPPISPEIEPQNTPEKTSQKDA